MQGLTRTVSAIMLMMVVMVSGTQAVQPGGPTLGEQAEQALSAGDAVLATELYEKWLEANPGDYVGWYNYACALALTGQLQEALRALDDAATAGWRDAEWPQRDPDLALIHDMPGFTRIIKRIEDLAEMEQDVTEKRDKPYYTTQTRLAPYLTVLPATYREDGEPHTVVVLLHGRGGDMQDLRELPDRLALANIVYLLPRAPYTVRRGVEGFSYWPRSLAAQNSDDYELARMYTVDWIGNVVSHAAANLNIDTSHVVLAGYSQGASAALLMAMRRPDSIFGVASIAGYMPYGEDTAEAFTLAVRKNVKLFIAHGTRDRVVTREQTQQIRELAQEAGLPVAYLETPDDHEISDEMIVGLAEWLTEVLEQAKQGD